MFTLEDKVNLCMAYIACDDEMMRAQAKAMIVKALKETNTDIQPEKDVMPSADIDNVIDEVLMDIGVPCHLAGYDALACAIRLVLSDPHYIGEMTKRLYIDVAKQVNSTASRVERSMRHATEVAFRKGDWATLSDMFGNSVDMARGKPTNQHMVAQCYKMVKHRLKQRGVEV